MENTLADAAALKSLRRRWYGLALGSAAFLAGGCIFLLNYWPAGYALRWLVLALLALGYLLGMLRRLLPLNHRPGDAELLPDLGLPNLVTFWRGALLAAAAGFLTLPRPTAELVWLPGILFSLGVLPDYLDGYLARVTRRSTLLGAEFDVHVDYLAFLAGSLLAIQYGQVPVWYILVVLARYLFAGGLWLRRRLGKPVYDLPPSLARRALSGSQMGFTMVMLWPLFAPPATTFAAYLFTFPFLANFTRDWFYASGVLQAGERRGLPNWLVNWLPPVLRLLAALALGKALLDWLVNYQEQIARLTRLGASQPALLAGLISGLLAAAALCLALGFITRTMAIIGLCLAGFLLQLGISSTSLLFLSVVCTTMLFFLGSGRLSLWSPEEILLQRKAGEPEDD